MASMTDHTPEPWQGGGASLWARQDGNNVIVASFEGSRVLREETKRANAKRARTCVNFCAGLPLDQIEAWLKRGLNAADLIAERDALAVKMAEIQGGKS